MGRTRATAPHGSARTPPAPTAAPASSQGDIVIRISDDNTQLHPPAVVDTGPHHLPHTPHAVAYRLRTRADLDPIAIPDAARLLAEGGHSNPRLHHDHRIISANLRAAVLALWKL